MGASRILERPRPSEVKTIFLVFSCSLVPEFFIVLIYPLDLSLTFIVRCFLQEMAVDVVLAEIKKNGRDFWI